MERLESKKLHLERRKMRIRSRVIGTGEQPRLSVHISNHHVTAQIIDDSKQTTLVYITTVGQKAVGTMTEKAAWVGTELAKKAKTAKIKKITFDRNGRLFHGRIKALAEAARVGGLEF